MKREPDPTRREIRTAARLLLLDPAGRVLLFLHADGHGRKFWATPGGGLEEGESLEEAARREAAEELGSAHVELTYLWTGRSDFQFEDRQVSQTEAFFLARGHSGVIGPEVEEEHRRERILEVRWWSLAEIEAYKEAIFPVDLAARVREHLVPPP